MRLADILSTYPDAALDRLASDKIDEVSNLRLPRTVLIEEIGAALSSLSYVAQALAPARPPTYAFLKLLLEASELAVPVVGFRERVEQEADGLTRQAADGNGLARGKDYELYLRVLYAAWENEGHVDRSEAVLLAALREALGIWTREHLLLEHHPTVRPLWAGERAYDDARNHLLATGLVLTRESSYVVADEVSVQLRRAWEIDLSSSDYRRLLALLTGEQLRRILEGMGLPLSGSKEERMDRVVTAMVPPPLVLDTLNIAEVRTLCRTLGVSSRGNKADLISATIDCFERGDDIQNVDQVVEVEPEPPPGPEPRELDESGMGRLLQAFGIDQLHDMLASLSLARSGSKGDRIRRLVDSRYAERTVIKQIRRKDLVHVCRKLGVPFSGVKDELVERLVAWAATGATSNTSEAEAAKAAELVAAVAETETGNDAVHGATESVQEKGASVPPSRDPDPRAAPPAGLHDIEVDFPQLGRDEQIVLALVREAKSLNEREIERSAQRHRLGWFLTKAHMADLVARLQTEGLSPIQIRSAGGINIYEWHDSIRSAPERLDREASRDVIDALRNGVVPERHLDLLAVGQDAARRHLVSLLEHVRGARSEFKFLRGAYGAGKSFLCSWLREQAYTHGFAVATVRIGPDQPLSDLPVFFAGLVNGLRTPEKRDSSALADVLEYWLLAVHRKTAQIESLSAFDEADQAKLAPLVESRIGEELDRIARHDPGFAPAVRAFYRARRTSDHALATTSLAWLRGSSVLSASALGALGVRGQLESEQVFPRLRALLEVVATGRLQGLLLLVDELELVRRFPHARQREQCYETLRLLIDETGENDLPGCLLIFTGTDELFDDARYGLGSYEALANRITTPGPSEGVVSMRQPVIRLEALDRERLMGVARRVREIHATAYGWPAGVRVADATIEAIVDEMTCFGAERVDRLPRPFLRKLVHVLDLCEENPNVDASEFLRVRHSTPELASVVVGLLED